VEILAKNFFIMIPKYNVVE